MNNTISAAAAKLYASYNGAVANGQVLDVSNIRTDGVGARSMDFPKSLGGAKKWIGDLPVISNNYQSYAFAMELLGLVYQQPEAYQQFATMFLQQHGEGKLERQGTAVRPMPTTPFPPASQGALMVPINQLVQATQARSPAKRAGPRVRQAGVRAVQATRVQAPLVQQVMSGRPATSRVQAPSVFPQAQQRMQPAPLAPLAPRAPSPPRYGQVQQVNFNTVRR